MKICIHRGATQIGGTCIEIEAQGKRLLLDIGQPLDSPDAASVEMPRVKGLKTPDDSLLGVVLSHPHLDHYGLAARVHPDAPFLMGPAAERILKAAAVFTPSGGTFKNVIHLENGKPIKRSPFTITPYLMDHSAYDSYAVLVEADGQRVFYTGDLRGHGRKAKLFERLVAHPPADVDVLLMEGTTIGRPETEKGFPTETDLENQLVDIFRSTKGLPLVWCSGQNIDRLVTVFRAAKRSGRDFIVDMYTAHILRATGNASIPQADWKGMRVFLPIFQKARIKRQRDFALAKEYDAYRIYPEKLSEAASRSAMLFRPTMQIDVERANCLDGACCVYSMWEGYLREEKQVQFLAWLKAYEIPIRQCHTSGHAPLADLRRLRQAFSTATLVPIHTPAAPAYTKLFDRVEHHADGEWWTIEKEPHHEEPSQT